MSNPFNKHWLVVGALWAVLGCCAGLFVVGTGWEAALVIVCFCLLAGSAVLSLVLKKPSHFAVRGLFALLGVLWVLARVGPLLAETPFEGRMVGRVCARPQPLNYGVRTVLDDVWVEEADGWRKVNGRVSLLSDVSGAQYGDTLLAEVQLEKPQSQRNPGGWDAKSSMLAEGISLSGSAPKGKAVVAVQGSFSPLRGVHALGTAMEDTIRASAGTEAGNTLIGVLFGDVAGLDFETLDDFRLSGTAHVLSVSGLHVSALAGALLWLLGKKRRSWGVFFAVGFVLLGFSALSGFSITVVRAALSTTFAMARRMRGHQGDMRQNIAFAALVQCAINPACILSVGFVLSYGAVLGIAVLYHHFRNILVKLLPKNVVFEKVADALAVSAAAQLGVLPASLYFFGMLPVLSLVWNIMTIPLTGIAVFLGLAGGLLGAIWLPLGAPLIMGAGGLCMLMRGIAEIGGRIPLSSIAVGGGSVLVAAGLVIAGFAISPFVRRRWVRITGVVLCAGLCAVAFFQRAGERSGLTITMLDVGQGDAIAISCGGHAVLLDGGNRTAFTDRGASVVLPYLRHMGVRRLDAAIATHNDSDHAGGLLRVCQRMEVGGLLLSGMEGDVGFGELLACTQERDMHVQTLIPGDVLRLGDAKLTVLHAGAGGDNEDSIVFLLEYSGFSALFTGDVGFKSEQTFADLAGEVTLLKVGHHGSKNSTSQELLEITKPKIAIISVGVGNAYGLPSGETLERLHAAGAKVYSTAEYGAITVRVTEGGVFLSTMLD